MRRMVARQSSNRARQRVHDADVGGGHEQTDDECAKGADIEAHAHQFVRRDAGVSSMAEHARL